MSKRKATAADDDNDSDVSLVDVDFDFFDPNPEIDYLALKRLATQLFNGDAERLHLQDLADVVLAQPQVGTTIKCDGKESDPYAFLTVLNLHTHRERPFAQALTSYLLKAASRDSNVHTALQTLLGPAGLQSQNHVGFVFSERLRNMPVQLVPPMYKMLEEELKWAVDDNAPFRFSHLLFLSQTYKLSPEEVTELEQAGPRAKRSKTVPTSAHGGVMPVHPEDEEIAKFASHTLDFPYSNSEPREEEAFGLDTSLRLMLVPADRLSRLVKAIEDAYPPPS